MRSGSATKAIPWIALVGLGLAAAMLALIGLGDLPLRDFDEATVARVALEMRHGLGEAPLLPTLWGKPYLNKAPGLHSLIALVISTTTPDQLPLGMVGTPGAGRAVVHGGASWRMAAMGASPW